MDKINYINKRINNNLNKSVTLNKSNNDKSDNEKIDNINKIKDIKQANSINQRKSDKIKDTHFLLNKLKELSQKSKEQMKNYKTNENNKNVNDIDNTNEINQIERVDNINNRNKYKHDNKQHPNKNKNKNNKTRYKRKYHYRDEYNITSHPSKRSFKIKDILDTVALLSTNENDFIEPLSYIDIFNMKDKDKWLKAVDEELGNMKRMNVFYNCG